ncbi:hypothetical protein [Geitlerinema sp. PCC 9228]|uniref:hypothetical protein n=1 Tax=Geitlerinema sp. PCC 9228 TaxID=111611 RepID=UPI00147A897D|nr:hypothetical protein [Geitlerinema sp. PCC 9228]
MYPSWLYLMRSPTDNFFTSLGHIIIVHHTPDLAIAIATRCLFDRTCLAIGYLS